MKASRLIFCVVGLALLFGIPCLTPRGILAAAYDPAAADYAGRQGTTLYVSKLGDDSDGSSWQKAYRTIQAALSALPDALGGHRVVVRPDRYVEEMLHGQAGAPGAYNLLVGDTDGKLGSGATGRVILDTSDPMHTPHQVMQLDKPVVVRSGNRYHDWHTLFRGDPNYSAKVWDRWIIRKIYTAGSEGLGWECGREPGMEFSVVMEDCVSIGRFAGAFVMGHIGRKDEPVVFRRCYFLSLDWWGDAGGVCVRAHNKAMPDYPDAVFEDCTTTGVDNAVQVGYPGFEGYTRLKFTQCRLVSLNFSLPDGTPSSGVVCCDLDGKYLHLDLEDCILVGGKLFGHSDPVINKAPGPVKSTFSYAVKGKVSAYVSDHQAVPEDIERLREWPTEVFDRLLPLRLPAPK